MTNDCLVTKFKKAVANDSLPKFNVLRVDFSAGTAQTMYCGYASGTEGGTIKCIGGTITLNGVTSTEITISGGQNKAFSVSGDKCYLEIENKYGLKTLGGIGSRATFDVSDVNFCDKLTELSLGGSKVYGIFDVNSPITTLSLADCVEISGSMSKILSKIDNATLMSSTNDFNISSTKIEVGFDILLPKIATSVRRLFGGIFYGNISQLASYPFTLLYVRDGSHIAGSVESYVSAAISNGRTSGSFTLSGIQKFIYITYNDASVSTLSTETFSWDAQGNITWS